MKRKWNILVVCLLILAMLSGCAADTDTKPDSSGTKETADGNEQITITMAIATGMSEYYDIAENYMKEHENIKIEIEEYPTSELRSLIMAKLAGGDCWDIFASFPPQFTDIANSGQVADLSDLEDIVDRYNSPEAVRSSRIKNGELMALPAQYQYVSFFYNRTLFKDLNLEVPEDWEQLKNVIEVAKENGLIPIAAGVKENWMPNLLLNQFASVEVQAKDLDWGTKRHNNEVTFAGTEGWVRSVEKIKWLVDNGAFSESAVSTSDEQAMMSFLNGEALMFFTGSWDLNGLIDGMPDGFDMGAMRIPSNDPGVPGCTSTALAGDFSIWKNSPHLEETKEWFAYTLSPEQNLLLNTTKGPSPFADVDVPIHDSLVEFEGWVEKSGGAVVESANNQQV